jgi:DNA-binding NarL/FixJ family response regulator
MRAYLVEDSPILAPMLTRLVERVPGALVVGHAADAPSAILGIAELTPDVAIINLQLEVGTGFDVLQAMATIHPKPVAIVLTNDVTADARAEAFGLGAAYYFDKLRDLHAMTTVLADLSEVLRQRSQAHDDPSMAA